MSLRTVMLADSPLVLWILDELTGATQYQNTVVDVSTTATWSTTASPDRVRGGLRSDDGRATGYYPGRLAAVALYPTALSAAQISVHYQEGRRSMVVV